jgi:hypothetical protein
MRRGKSYFSKKVKCYNQTVRYKKARWSDTFSASDIQYRFRLISIGTLWNKPREKYFSKKF